LHVHAVSVTNITTQCGVERKKLNSNKVNDEDNLWLS
jgi:hypothetical protein